MYTRANVTNLDAIEQNETASAAQAKGRALLSHAQQRRLTRFCDLRPSTRPMAKAARIAPVYNAELRSCSGSIVPLMAMRRAARSVAGAVFSRK